MWRQRLAFAMRKRKAASEEGPTAVVKRAKTLFKAPLESTHHWLCSLNSAMHDSLGHGLEKYVNTHPERPYNDDFEEGEKDHQKYLTFCMDEEQKQLAGFYFLERKLALNIFRLMPPLHRRHNDLVNSLVRADCYELVALTVLQRNISYGPWNAGGNLQELWETGLEMMRQLDPDDAFLCKLWPRICRDRGYTEPEQCGREARARLLATLPAFRPFAVKGPRAAPSKWMSCLKAISYEKPDATLKMMGIAFLAVHKGWVEDLDDFLNPPSQLSIMQEAALAKHFPKGVTAVQASAPASSSSDPAPSSTAAATAATASRAGAKAKARAQIRKVISKSPSALVAVGKLMANQEYRDLQLVVLVLFEGLMQEHTWCVRVLKTREGVREYYLKMSRGHWLEPLWHAVDCHRLWHKFRDVVALTTELQAKMRKNLKADDPLVQMEDSFCEIIWKLTMSLVTERAASCQFHSGSYPGLLAGMLGDEGNQAATMATFKAHWEAYCCARDCQLPKVQEMCRRSPLNTRPLEQLARIAKASNWQVCNEFRHKVELIFGGLCQEDIVEDSLGKVRDTEYRDASSRVLRLFKSFEVPVMAKQLERWGRDEVKITPELPMHSTAGNYEDYFRIRAYDDFDMSSVKASGAQHDWETFTPTTCRVASAELALMKHIAEERNGDFLLLGEAWKASVVPRGCVVIRKTGDRCTVFFSLLPTSAGVLAWPCARVSDRYVRLPGKGHCPYWAPVFDLDEHYVLPTKVHSPLHSFLDEMPLEQVGILAAHEKPVKLVEYQASRGFAGVPETSLKMLFGEFGKQVPEHSPEAKVPQDVAWAAELINILQPDMEPAKMQEALMTRATSANNITETLLSDVWSDEMMQDCLRDQDRKAMKDIIGTTAKAKESRLQHAEHIKKLVADRPTKKKAKVAKTSVEKEAAKDSVMTEKGALRWWCSVKGDMAYIDRWRPPIGAVVKDDNNGAVVVFWYPTQASSGSL
jgi:hypothetical protein